MTVIDTSGVVDFLLGSGVAAEVEVFLNAETELAAPDVLIFEVLAVLRREALGSRIAASRAAAAVSDLGDMGIELFPALALRERAWQLRHNLTAADALFVALAEELGEPLATKDSALATAASEHGDVQVIRLGDPG